MLKKKQIPNNKMRLEPEILVKKHLEESKKKQACDRIEN